LRTLLLAGFLTATPLLAQAPTVQVALAPSEPAVGDHVTATLTLRVPDGTGDAGDAPRFPVWGATWGEAEVVAKSPPEKAGQEDGAAVWRQRLVIVAFRPGRVPLTPVRIAVPLAGRTLQVPTPAGLSLDVRSVLPAAEKDPQPQAKPALPPRPLPIGERFWWTLAAFSTLVLAAALLLWWQSRKRRADPAAERPLLAPFDELVVELARLRGEPSVIQVHTRISLALRRYLARVLPFPAVESTTSEVQRQLLSRRMPGPLVRQMVELLRACDLVKFARQEAGEARAAERIEAARTVARELETHLAPPEPAKLEAAG